MPICQTSLILEIEGSKKSSDEYVGTLGRPWMMLIYENKYMKKTALYSQSLWLQIFQIHTQIYLYMLHRSFIEP